MSNAGSGVYGGTAEQGRLVLTALHQALAFILNEIHQSKCRTVPVTLLASLTAGFRGQHYSS